MGTARNWSVSGGLPNKEKLGSQFEMTGIAGIFIFDRENAAKIVEIASRAQLQCYTSAFTWVTCHFMLAKPMAEATIGCTRTT